MVIESGWVGGGWCGARTARTRSDGVLFMCANRVYTHTYIFGWHTAHKKRLFTLSRCRVPRKSVYYGANDEWWKVFVCVRNCLARGAYLRSCTHTGDDEDHQVDGKGCLCWLWVLENCAQNKHTSNNPMAAWDIDTVGAKPSASDAMLSRVCVGSFVSHGFRSSHFNNTLGIFIYTSPIPRDYAISVRGAFAIVPRALCLN